jgi:membrane-bound inhibitor of C-type lysozyme
VGQEVLSLSHVRSGSGARYDGEGAVWWTKGPSARLERGGRTVEKECAMQQ